MGPRRKIIDADYPITDLGILSSGEGGTNICIYGPTNMGKTHLLKYLLYGWQKNATFDYYYAFSGTSTDSSLGKVFDSRYINNDLSPANILRFLRLAQKKHEQNPAIRGLVVFDDVGGNRKGLDYPALSEFWNNSRHAGLTTIFCIQRHTLVPPEIRTQVKVWFIFHVLGNETEMNFLCKNACAGSQHEFKRALIDLGPTALQRRCLVSFTGFCPDNGLGGSGVGIMFFTAPGMIPPFWIGPKVRKGDQFQPS
jgi:hypothetical protein